MFHLHSSISSFMCISNDRIVEVLWGKAQKEFRSSKHDILHTVYASTPYRRMGRDFAGIKFEITVVSTTGVVE
jgi:hypothetical protein